MHQGLAFALSVAVIAWTTNTVADSQKLKGEYGFTGTANCLVAPGSVPEGPVETNPTPGTAFPNSDSMRGCSRSIKDRHSRGHLPSRDSYVQRRRNRDGQGYGRGHLRSSDPGAERFPHFPAFRAVCGTSTSLQFTYTVNGDGELDLRHGAGQLHRDFLDRAAHRTRAADRPVDAIPPVDGHISHDGKTLIAAHITTAVESTPIRTATSIRKSAIARACSLPCRRAMTSNGAGVP